MTINIRVLALACAILWGGAVLLVSMANLIFGGYGQGFLEVMSSCYPGYHATRSIVEVAIVTLYATADGLIAGAIFGWLYNRLAHVARISHS